MKGEAPVRIWNIIRPISLTIAWSQRAKTRAAHAKSLGLQPQKVAMTTNEHIKLRLKDFAPASPDAPDLIWGGIGDRCPIATKQFPVPNLLLFLLCEVCKFPLEPRGDKTHWTVPFTYKGINYVISLEKFGLLFYVERRPNSKPKEVLGKLRKTLDSAEKHILSDFASQQIASGNITIRNQFNRLGDQSLISAESRYLLSPR